MRILYGRVFGLGNAVMAVPAIKALSIAHGGKVDILIGSTPDDAGAFDVLKELVGFSVENIWVDQVLHHEYDVAVMAIPFDGRWRNGVHFRAKTVIDTRPRPDFSPTLGLSSWKKHETEYQMDNARELGYPESYPRPSGIFRPKHVKQDPDLVYLGLGFKRDQSTFWSVKHWGNDRYVEFIKAVRAIRPSTRFISTGNMADVIQVGAPIMAQIKDSDVFVCKNHRLEQSFDIVAGCHAYFGNDTGMMHVAASFGYIPTYVMMAIPGSDIKNPPLSDRAMTRRFLPEGSSSPSDVAHDFVEFVWGTGTEP